MFQAKGVPVSPLKEYILNLTNQEKEGMFFKMLKESKSRLTQSLENENPVEKYIKGFAEKKLFDKTAKGTFLNLKV